MVGCKDGKGCVPEMLNFGGDACYYAYIVYGEDVVIGSHYHKVSEFEYQLRIYDDDELTFRVQGRKIVVYRAGEMGCIIQIIGSRS